ncbi:MAG: fibronectin type III domain-containing protein [Pseudomonadota bacterium]|jgi:hypothetical protein|nr:fibronectin type III domain-containing protein [Pseudomonadota bacterium]
MNRHPFSPPGRLRSCLCVLSCVIAALLLSGCQEDTRASKLDTQRASEVADERLRQTQGSLLATLGQEPTQADTAREPTATASERPRALSWTAPLTREDGTALSPGQIAGYRIYYRLRHQSEFQVIKVPDGGTTRYSLAPFDPGAYEFAISTVDVNGLESQRSTPVVVNLI